MVKTKVQIKPSTNPLKKFDALMHEPGVGVVKVSFGQRGAEDFTTHGDQQRKENYLKRHAPREDWSNYRTSGFWAARLLWDKRTLAASARQIERDFPQLRVSF